MVVANLEQLSWLKGILQDKYEIKSTIMGPEAGLPKQAKILNRTLRWTPSGIEYEADPNRANIIMEECEIMSSRPSKVTGVPEKINDEDQPEFLGDAAATKSERWPRESTTLHKIELTCNLQPRTLAREWQGRRPLTGSQRKGWRGT